LAYQVRNQLIDALIAKSKFIGLESVTHLAAGGESPMLKSHQQAVEQFMLDKSRGAQARELQANMVELVQWQPGDNVVVADVEFPSGILPWTRFEKMGVEVRVVRHQNWFIDIDDIAELIDERTRVVTISHVSMFTGQRIDLKALSNLVRSSNALLLLDSTHAAGAVPVDASLADIMVSSCYKWLLGTHGAAVFYVNHERLPDFQPPFLGWNNSVKHGGWENPTEFSLQPTAHQFQPGNAGFISIYILNNALDHILSVGINAIEQHVLALSGRIHEAVDSLGFELMTPGKSSHRAGNVCFMAGNLQAVLQKLEQQQVLIWGAYAGFGRLRISTHLYNDSNDVDRCIMALQP